MPVTTATGLNRWSRRACARVVQATVALTVPALTRHARS